MSDAENVSVWGTLNEFGFQPDASVLSDVSPGLTYDFGNFKLSASCCLGKWFKEVVLFTGVMSSSRSLAEVCFEMPRHVCSAEQCAAWIVWHLDRASEARHFLPKLAAAWLVIGRENAHSLPWEQERMRREQMLERYDARPQCQVQRDWLKLSLRKVADMLQGVQDGERVSVGFDGRILSFACAGKTSMTEATGTAWPAAYTLPATSLRNLPKRLMCVNVAVSVWDGSLQIDRYFYPSVIEQAGITENGVNQ
jgi:hypothetical protein